jgi:tetratricopeptide (TPR) repeat protein
MVGNEEGLAVTYSQLGKVFYDSDRMVEAERCLNNAAEHFIKLGNEASEAACLRMLAHIYHRQNNAVAAIRCLERVLLVDQRYRLPEMDEDRRLYDEVRHVGGSHS